MAFRPQADGAGPPTWELQGIVLDEQGEPVEGAQLAGYRNPRLSATTDELGRFALERAPSRELELVVVSASGYAPALANCLAGRWNTMRLTRGVCVSGRLLLAGEDGARAPLPGRELAVMGLKNWRVALTTAADGAFQFFIAPGNNAEIEVLFEGQASFVETVSAGDQDVCRDVVVSRPLLPLEVLVTDQATGAPLPGCMVLRNRRGVGTTDAQGRLAFLTYPGQGSEVRAGHDGYCDTFVAVRNEPTVRLELVRAATLRGRVEDPSGAPVAGAPVTLILVDRTWSNPRIASLESLATTLTDEAGAFGFDGLGTSAGFSRVRLEVCCASFAPYETEVVEVPNAGAIGPVVCRLQPGASLSGTVTLHGASTRATVFIEDLDEPHSTDDLGRYAIPNLSPGPAMLCVSLDAHPGVKRRLPLQLVTGPATQDVAFGLSLAPFTGVVSTPEGLPLVGARVLFESATLYDDQPATYAATTDAAGFYRVEVPVQADDSEQTYTARLGRWPDDCALEGLRPPARVDLVCAAHATVALTAVDSARGRVGWFDLAWQPDGAPEPFECKERQDLRGGRVVATVPTGPGRVVIREWSRELDLAPGETIDLGEVDLGAPTDGR